METTRASDASSMRGKVVLVTGANSGLGRQTALELARRGARVVLGCRDPAKGLEALGEIRNATGNTELALLPLDLASLGSVRQAARTFLSSHQRLDVLVNNAGIFTARRQRSADGHELTFAVNFLGPFLLTRLLLEALQQSAPSRIVNVSSAAHARGRIRWDDLGRSRRWSGGAAYAQSKLALNLFTLELARRLEGTGVTANAVHPGFVATELARGEPGPIRWVMRLFELSVEEGARGPVHLASAPEAQQFTGCYFEGTRRAEPSAASVDAAAAARLWALGERLTGEVPPPRAEVPDELGPPFNSPPAPAPAY